MNAHDNHKDVLETVEKMISTVSEMICETVPAADPPFGQSTQEHCSVESGTDENIFTNTDTNQIGNSEGFAQSVYSEEIKEDAPENEDKHNAITEGMENMITDSVGKESTTDEGVIEKDKTNAAFENVLTQSTAAKAEATEAYKKSDLETARLKYMTALELLQNVHGDLSNKQKSTLFEQTVACNNNVALCCMGLDDLTNCVAFATNSLMLIRSLERNIPNGLIWKCLTENGVTLDQLQKVWKKKALYYSGKAQLKRKNYKEAAELLEEALGLTMDDPKLAANTNELRTLLADAKARHSREMRREKSTWAKAFKKGKTEAESMYSDVAPDSAPPSAQTSPVNANGQNFDSNNLKFDLSDLDINKKKKKADTVAVRSDFAFSPLGVLLVSFVSLGLIGGFFWMRHKR